MDKKYVFDIKKGCIVSYEKFFKKEYNSLFGYCLRLVKDTESAKELVNDSFMQLWSKRESIDENTNSLRPYIFRILHNKSINFLQRQKENSFLSFDNFTYESDLFADPSSSITYEHELEEAIKLAIEKLPFQRKRIFEMSRFRQMTYKEIALELGISKKTVENQISRALSFLRSELKDFE